MASTYELILFREETRDDGKVALLRIPLVAGAGIDLDAVIGEVSAGSGVSVQEGYAESEGTSSTTSTNFQQKLRASLTGLDAGTYEVAWSCEVLPGKNNLAARVRVQVDDTTTLNSPDPVLNRDNSGGNVKGWMPLSGFRQLALSAGDHDFDIDFASPQNGKSVDIRFARIKIARTN